MPNQYHDKLQTSRLVTNFLSMNDAVTWSAFFAHPEAIRFLFINTSVALLDRISIGFEESIVTSDVLSNFR